MPPGLHRQVGGLFHGRDESGERRLQELPGNGAGGGGGLGGGGGGHWETSSYPQGGWGLLVMYMVVNWEMVNSIYRHYSVVNFPNLAID
jgi:hypothetical protein